MKRIAPALALLGILFAAPAAAQSAMKIVEDFGYPGRWAADCGAPASPKNTVLTVALLPYGTVEQRYAFGPDSSDVYEVLEATRTSEHELTMKIGSGFGLIRILVIRREGETIRAMQLRREDGSSITEDGIVLMTKEPTQRLTRCK